MRKLLAFLIVAILCFSSLSAFAAAPESDKTDRYTAVGDVLKKAGVISGTDKGLEEFSPLTREQALAITVRMNGWDKDMSDYQPLGLFSDVPSHHWAAKYVEIARIKGLTEGIGDGKFGLGQRVTKKQFLSYMLRTLGHTADWAKEDIMAKAKLLNLSNDAANQDKQEMLRGQAFIYMANALLQPAKDKSKALYAELGLKNEYFTKNDKNKGTSTDKDNKDNDKKVDKNKRKRVTKKTFDDTEYPRPIKASTPTFDELKVEFNTLISRPEKKNFKFTVSDGRTLSDSAYTIAPGGSDIIFHFKSQNLHGKTLTCTMKGLVSSGGKPMLGEGVIKATYKDFTPIYFTNTKILSEKQYEAFLSIDVKKGSFPAGYSVTSDGRELVEKVDYEMSWGGKRFAPRFKNEAAYPKRESTLTIWGWVTSPYEKYLDEPISITVDFEGERNRDYDAPPVDDAVEPTVDFTIDDEILDRIIDEINKDIDCIAPYIENHSKTRNGFEFYTAAPIKEIRGLYLRDVTGKKHRCDYTINNNRESFRVYIGSINAEIDALLVDNIICNICKAETGPIEYRLNEVGQNQNSSQKPFVMGWKRLPAGGIYFETKEMVGKIEGLKYDTLQEHGLEFEYIIDPVNKGFTMLTGSTNVVPGRLLVDNIISKDGKAETGRFEFSVFDVIN